MADNDTADGSDDEVTREASEGASSAEQRSADSRAAEPRDGGDRGTESREADQGEAADREDPAEMDLAELRREIRTIDREIVELVAQRTYVAESIAEVKRKQGLPTTDESQEEAVMERAGENAEQFDVDANLVKAVFRLLIELNKIEQRHNEETDGQDGDTGFNK